ncbi:MAG: acetyl-CoA carboxylase biotin carboxylase subunit [Deltaproteobacteria bacterium]|nr:acetyl-CoA carboxylase biotin carboxylase subunit [Deltaproteobacteria bacterium]
MFKKVLIANRGEIAVRIIRACREIGVRTVAVHSEADTHALHVRLADEAVCIGPSAPGKSYLHIPAIIAAAEIAGADAIHPGYGFLSENAEFAEVCRRCGIVFIGPTPEAMKQWGDKVSGRSNAVRFGLPLLPGSGVLRDAAHARAEAGRIGYPVILKASGGGGGRGMRIVRSPEEIGQAFASATAEAASGFKNPDVYVERFVERPRHVEFQVLVDKHGTARSLGERECSLQRRHQKIIEESPSPWMTPEVRADLGARIERAMIETGYDGVGTLEFLLDPDAQGGGQLYFMEMNTRLQVEHPVTEMVTGLDLVVEQILVAAGGKIATPQRDFRFRGHSIECRINAEDPVTFAPWPGVITEYHPPGGNGVRVDGGVYGGWRVPSNYDSLIAKVITHAPTRERALKRMERALDEFIIGGIRTNIPLHKRLVQHEDVRAGRMTTRTIEELVAPDRQR